MKNIFLAILIIFKSISSISQTNQETIKAMNEKRYEDVIRIAQPLADSGNNKAQFDMGIMNMNGWGFDENYIEAVKWMQLSANNGNINAQFVLGNMYFQGLGLSPDHNLAFIWRKKSATAGQQYAAFEVAEMYMMGVGIEKNENEAKKFYQFFIDGTKSNLNSTIQKKIGTAKARILEIESGKITVDSDNSCKGTGCNLNSIEIKMNSNNIIPTRNNNIENMRKELVTLKLQKEIDDLKQIKQLAANNENYQASLKIAIAKCMENVKDGWCALGCLDPQSRTLRMNQTCVHTCEDREQARITACQNIK